MGDARLVTQAISKKIWKRHGRWLRIWKKRFDKGTQKNGWDENILKGGIERAEGMMRIVQMQEKSEKRWAGGTP